MRVLLVSLISIIIVSACNNINKNESKDGKLRGTISVSGAFALYPMAQKWVEEFMKLNPEVKIDVSAGGAGKGMTDVLNNMVDLAMYSKSISKVEVDKGAFGISVTKDAVFPVISKDNPYLAQLKANGLTKAQFIDIYVSGKITSWDKLLNVKGKEKINLYSRSDACGAAEMWAKYLGKKQEDLKGIGVYGDPGIAEAVKKDKFAIGFNNLAYVYDINTNKKQVGLEIIPLDLNDDGKIDKDEYFYDSVTDIIEAVKTNRYPSPPSRELYFVSKGKPTNKLVIAFLNWILTDGQKYVTMAGYVELPKDVIDKEILKLK